MNSRIKKKKFKNKILNMKPNDIMVLRFSLENLDLDVIDTFFKCCKKVIPPYASLIAIPDEIILDTCTKEDLKNIINNIQKMIDEDNNE